MSRRDRRARLRTATPAVAPPPPPPPPVAAADPAPSGYITTIDADGKPHLMAYWNAGVLEAAEVAA